MKCTIRTPQFKNGKVHEWKIQEGNLDEKTLLFTTDTICGHDVHFSSMENFKEFEYNEKKKTLLSFLKK